MIKLNLQLFGGRGASSSVTSSASGAGKPNDATEWYVSGEGMWINDYLRGRGGDFGELSDREKQYLKDLDKATSGKVKEKELYRNVDASAIFGDMTNSEFDDMRAEIVYNGFSKDKGKYAQGIAANINNKIEQTKGKVITDKGFVSTTKDERIANDFDGFTGSEKPIILKIKTNSNTKGVDVSVYDKNVSKADAQKEVLLGRNQKYKVDNIYGKNGHIYVDVSMQ